MESVYQSKKSNCCGCTACLHICPKGAISMKADGEGFSYPAIDSGICVDCGLCEKACPISHHEKPDSPHHAVYAVKHKDAAVLERSSSGGMFTAFSDYVLGKGGVVYGCKYDERFVLTYARADDTRNRDSLCGSKYIQADLADTYAEVKYDLKRGIYVCFVGTACYCAGLYSFLKQQNVDISKLLTLSFICHGVPSPLLFHEYVDYCNKKRKAAIVDYEHRPKHRFWGHIERAKFVYDNGDSDSDSDSDLSQAWKWLFYSNAPLRHCCYECLWAKHGHASDVTIGDFWGIEDCQPEFYDKMGVSVVLTNSKKGDDVFKAIRSNLIVKEAKYEDAIKKNPNLVASSVPLVDRATFWNVYHSKGFGALITKYGHISMYYKLKSLARIVLKKIGFRK